ncbi:MAG: DUF488 domain-containing protein [Acidimicrobiales bacterium]
MTGALRRAPKIEVRRIYQPEGLEAAAGYRVLVDRLWPRGVRKAGAPIDEWLRDVAPSTELRKWYGHAPERFVEFRERYITELRCPPASKVACGLARQARRAPLLLVTATRDVEHSGAVVLRDHLARLAGGDDEEGGDPACWAEQVCEACGQIREEPHHCSADR